VEGLARIDRVQELVADLSGEPLLRSGSSAGALVLSVRPGAEGAVASGVPARVGAMRGLTRVRVTKTPLAVPCRRSSLEEHGRDDRDVKQNARTVLAS
jgi:hypothetical protein